MKRVELGMFSLPGVKIYEYGTHNKQEILDWMVKMSCGEEIQTDIFQFKSDNQRMLFLTRWAGDC